VAGPGVAGFEMSGCPAGLPPVGLRCFDDEVDNGDETLRDAARAWLRATDRLAAAGAETVEDSDVYAVVLELAEEAGIARIRMQRALVDLGWSPPASLRQLPRH